MFLMLMLALGFAAMAMMAFPADNPRTNYTIEYYAREALRWLRARKGIARLLNRAPESERNAAFEKGDMIKLRRPSTFTAQAHVDGTGTTTQGLHAQNVQIALDQEYEVKFGVTDKQLATAGPKLVNEHIGPAVDALVRKIEETVYALGHFVGPVADVSGSIGAEKIITIPREVLVANFAPMDENIFFAVDPSLSTKFLQDAIFHQAQVVGQGNAAALVDGLLGRRFGVNVFESQLAKRTVAQQTATLAAAGGGGDRLGAMAAAQAVNVNQFVVNALTDTQTLAINADTFTIAGDPTVYRVIAVGGAVASNQVTVTCFPALQQPAAGGAVVTFKQRLAIQDAAPGVIENLMFHRDAIGLVMAPQMDFEEGTGVTSFTATDEETGLSIRVRRFADGHSKQRYLAVDALWGVQLLNSQLAVRALRAAA